MMRFYGATRVPGQRCRRGDLSPTIRLGAIAALLVLMPAAAQPKADQEANKILPGAVTLAQGATQQFTCSPCKDGKTWSATGGTITPGGLYTAGSKNGMFQVTADLRPPKGQDPLTLLGDSSKITVAVKICTPQQDKDQIESKRPPSC